jgi:PhoPQ-activated pathogenicity-related protein
MSPKKCLYCLALMLFAIDATGEQPVRPTRTALEEYVAKKDDTYSWRVEKTVESPGLTSIVIRLKSQTWRTKKDVDRPVWEHWLVLAIPEKVTTTQAFLMIGGGSHDSKTPDGADLATATIAQATGSIVAELKNVPNQPMVFRTCLPGRKLLLVKIG